MNSQEPASFHYDSSKYRTPDGYTSDIALFTIVAEKLQQKLKAPPKMSLKLLLIKRAELNREGNPNIEGGKWALPGGFIAADETAYEAARRELEEETGIDVSHIKHFGVYDKIGRDARGWMISNAFYAIVPEHELSNRQAADDAADVELFDVEEVFGLELAFDHSIIIREALEHIKKDMIQTTVAKNFLPEEFTLSELQNVLMTVVRDSKIESDSVFFTKVPKLTFIEKAVDANGEPKKTTRNSYRPSQLYRFNDHEPQPSIYF